MQPVHQLPLTDVQAVQVDIVEDGEATPHNVIHDQSDRLDGRPRLDRWSYLCTVASVESYPLPTRNRQHLAAAVRAPGGMDHIVRSNDHELWCLPAALAVSTNIESERTDTRASRTLDNRASYGG